MDTRQMGEYERELERVRRARGEFEASQDEVELRKHEYFTAVRTLHETGMPLREIATALGLSHQRVHQMVEEAGEKKSRAARAARRVAKQGGVAFLILLAAVGGYAMRGPEASPHTERRAATAACHRVKMVYENGTKEFLTPEDNELDPMSCMPDPKMIFRKIEENKS